METQKNDNQQISSYVAYYLQKLHEKIGTADAVKGRLIFRGLPDVNWKVMSSAGRRLSGEQKYKQDDFIRYHVNLIANARKYGYGNLKPGSTLSDMEVLAEIQHYGGATCLLDFSTSFLISLWFATEQNLNTEKHKNNQGEVSIAFSNATTDGKIIIIDLGAEKNFNNIIYYNEQKKSDTIQRLLTRRFSDFESKKREVEPCFWFWDPTRLNNRIIDQHGVFLFGLSAFNSKKVDFIELQIDKEHKQFIRYELEQFFGISAETIYPDLTGYSLHSNGISVKISEKLLPRTHCYTNARECIKMGEYSLAISYLDEAIACKKRLQTVHCKQKKETSECNISDLFIGELYFWRGVSNENWENGSFEKTKEALLDYHLAVSDLQNEYSRFQSNKQKKKLIHKLLCESYRRQNTIFYGLKKYESAIEPAERMFKLYNDIDINDNNGIDAIFILMELSIMLFDDERFFKWNKRAEQITTTNTNGAILRLALESIGNAIFTLDADWNYSKLIEEIDNTTAQILKHIGERNGNNNTEFHAVLGYFYWIYSDILEWLQQVESNASLCSIREGADASKPNKFRKYVYENANAIHLVIQKAHDAQAKLLNKVFAESIASERTDSF